MKMRTWLSDWTERKAKGETEAEDPDEVCHPRKPRFSYATGGATPKTRMTNNDRPGIRPAWPANQLGLFAASKACGVQ